MEAGGAGSAGSGVIAGSGTSGFDDFNRPNGPLGSDWAIGSGSYEIIDNKFGNVGAANGWALYTGATSLYDLAVIEFDLQPNPTTLAYTAAVTGAGGSDMAFTKIQGSTTVILLSSLGPGPTITPFGEIEVTQPWRQTPRFQEIGGRFDWTSTVPIGSFGQTFYMQAVEFEAGGETELSNALAVQVG